MRTTCVAILNRLLLLLLFCCECREAPLGQPVITEQPGNTDMAAAVEETAYTAPSACSSHSPRREHGPDETTGAATPAELKRQGRHQRFVIWQGREMPQSLTGNKNGMNLSCLTREKNTAGDLLAQADCFSRVVGFLFMDWACLPEVHKRHMNWSDSASWVRLRSVSMSCSAKYCNHIIVCSRPLCMSAVMSCSSSFKVCTALSGPAPRQYSCGSLPPARQDSRCMLLLARSTSVTAGCSVITALGSCCYYIVSKRLLLLFLQALSLPRVDDKYGIVKECLKYMIMDAQTHTLSEWKCYDEIFNDVPNHMRLNWLPKVRSKIGGSYLSMDCWSIKVSSTQLKLPSCMSPDHVYACKWDYDVITTASCLHAA